MIVSDAIEHAINMSFEEDMRQIVYMIGEGSWGVCNNEMFNDGMAKYYFECNSDGPIGMGGFIDENWDLTFDESELANGLRYDNFELKENFG